MCTQQQMSQLCNHGRRARCETNMRALPCVASAPFLFACKAAYLFRRGVCKCTQVFNVHAGHEVLRFSQSAVLDPQLQKATSSNPDVAGLLQQAELRRQRDRDCTPDHSRCVLDLQATELYQSALRPRQARLEEHGAPQVYACFNYVLADSFVAHAVLMAREAGHAKAFTLHSGRAE